MKRQSLNKISEHLKVSALSMALTSIFYGSATATAQEIVDPLDQLTVRSFKTFAPSHNQEQAHLSYDSTDLNQVNQLDNLSEQNTSIQRNLLVQEFATATYHYMVGNTTSQIFLSNEHLTYSSTFPLRLLNKITKTPWRPSPILPIPDKDIGCYYGIPSYRTPLKYDPNTTPITIVANEVEGNLTEGVTFQGQVHITQADQSLKADRTEFHRPTGKILSSGNINYSSPEFTVNSFDYINTDLKTKITEFKKPSFQLNGSVLRGSSSFITLDRNKNTSKIKDLSFTTCPVGDNSWYILADDVDLDFEEKQGETTNTFLYIKDVPVFYVPYATFPLSNERKTGLLYPELSVSTTNGLDYSQPIYVNIAPNYDYTFTPRIMFKRGVLLQNEFRYMPFENTLGTIYFDFLPNDNIWTLSENEHDYRYYFRLKQSSSFFNDDLHFNIDYQAVRKNDFDYLNDLNPDDTQVTDDNLQRSFFIEYNRPEWSLSLEARDYQRLIPDDIIYSRLFTLMPQLRANYYNTYDAFTFNINSEITQFASPSESNYKRFSATRFHFEPAINYQLFNSRGTNLDVGFRGFLTHYEQDSLSNMPDYYQHNLGFTNLDSSVNRFLYLAEIRGKSTFERKVLDLRHTQTIEPEILYQYIPYKDQNNIANYDTTDRMHDYYTNFSFRHFTGKDRIVDLNRITLGVSSRLLDAHDRELLRFGVSQSIAFTPTQTTLMPIDFVDKYPRSPLAFYFNAKPTPQITTHASMSYSTKESEVDSWIAMAEYQNENGYLAQVSYRFARAGNRTLSNNIVDLKQFGLLGEIPLGKNFTLALATYNDLEQNQNIDTKVALKYEECCWSVSLIYENYNKTDWLDLSRQHEQKIGIQFEFKGLGAVNVTGDTEKRFTDTHLLHRFNPTNLSQ